MKFLRCFHIENKLKLEVSDKLSMQDPSTKDSKHFKDAAIIPWISPLENT